MRLSLLLWLVAGLVSPVAAQDPPLAERTSTTPEWTQERLEQLVAPIALYSDGVLAQVLMASTYPLEIVQAARWVAKNPKLEGAKLEAALQGQSWDPSVKSLCGLPSVLQQMNENLDWTQDLGDAFLAEKAKLMDAVQAMRRKALEAGQLKSSEQQKVTEQSDQVVVVEQTSTEVVYVPTYYPSVVYGGWSYPYWYYPSLYVPPPPRAPWYSFAAGAVWGAAIWGGCHWGAGHADVDIDVNYYNQWITKVDRQATALRVEGGAGERQAWEHRVEHRQGVTYGDARVAQRYGAAAGETRVTREQARGRVANTASGVAATEAPAARRDVADRSAFDSERSMGQRSSSFHGAETSSFERASSMRGASSRASSVRSSGAEPRASMNRTSGAIRSSGGRIGGRR